MGTPCLLWPPAPWQQDWSDWERLWKFGVETATCAVVTGDSGAGGGGSVDFEAQALGGAWTCWNSWCPQPCVVSPDP